MLSADVLSESNKLVFRWLLKCKFVNRTNSESQGEEHSLRKLVAKYCTRNLCFSANFIIFAAI